MSVVRCLVSRLFFLSALVYLLSQVSCSQTRSVSSVQLNERMRNLIAGFSNSDRLWSSVAVGDPTGKHLMMVPAAVVELATEIQEHDAVPSLVPYLFHGDKFVRIYVLLALDIATGTNFVNYDVGPDSPGSPRQIDESVACWIRWWDTEGRFLQKKPNGSMRDAFDITKVED